MKNLKEKKSKISALFLTQRPPDNWPDALDHLAIGLVANKCTKLEKISEIFELLAQPIRLDFGQLADKIKKHLPGFRFYNIFTVYDRYLKVKNVGNHASAF